jgi:outer membrane protein OmpA-like peptidoglycan-associated protein
MKIDLKAAVALSAAMTIAGSLTSCASRRPSEPTAYRYTSPTDTPELAALRAQLNTVESSATKRGIVLTIPDGFFETDKAELRAGARPDLMAIAAYLKGHPERKALIEGYTDSRGSSDHNLALARQRGTAVESFFLKNGVDPEHVEVRALGEQQPVATNRTAAGRQQNRRVEIVMVDAGPTAAR